MAEAVDRATEIQTEISDPSQETDKPSSEGLIEEQVAQNVEEVDYQPDCPVCLQLSFYPVKLPCGHIFCFLCIKGVVLRSRRCALCRHSVAVDYLDNPTLIKVVDKTVRDKEALKSEEEQVDGSQVQEFVWYYEGRNGWWTYDEKTSADVEKAFKNGQRSCTLLIAGFLYVIDFENMFQTRKNEPGRRRRIKRDKRDVESKGVAGIRVPPSSRRPTAVLNRTADSSSADKANNTENQSEVEHSTTGVSDEIHSPTGQNVGDSAADTGVEEIVSRISDEPNSKE
ncbi:E3 ubiquitin-protein ligase rnf146-like [Montipora capricornis]|uniref:E3 ubiquitin-protein ligase rnf146-like n=1 Tax=Montipora capricornis TaxID=246305 RepID=UPI0035F214EA